MAKLTYTTNVEGTKDVATLADKTAQALQDIQNMMNGKVEFDVNLLSQTVTVNFDAIGVDTAVIHKLNKQITGYIPIMKSGPCDIYIGQGQFTTNRIFLRSTAIASVTLVLL